MNNNFFTILDGSSFDTELYPLTENRNTASIPFFGKYRIVDFTLSALTKAGCKNIAIYPGRNTRSLIDHVGDASSWNLNLNKDGLFIVSESRAEVKKVVPYFLMLKNLQHILRSKQQYVVLGHTSIVHNIDFEELVNKHIESENEISIITNKGERIDYYILSKELLLILLKDYKKYFEIDIKHTIVNRKYLNTGEIDADCYIRDIDSLKAYFDVSMEILNLDAATDLSSNFNDYLLGVMTKRNFTPPSQYLEACKISNCRVSNGCIISGEIKNSILFRNVEVEEDVIIENSIIMANCKIKKGTVLKNVIIDKNTTVEEGCKIVGSEDFPKYYKFVGDLI